MFAFKEDQIEMISYFEPSFKQYKSNRIVLILSFFISIEIQLDIEFLAKKDHESRGMVAVPGILRPKWAAKLGAREWNS